MADTSIPIQASAHYDGERLVFDEPLHLPSGTKLRILIYQDVPREERNLSVEARLAAFDRLAEMGRGLHSIDPKYLDDRSMFYDDDHRAGLG